MAAQPGLTVDTNVIGGIVVTPAGKQRAGIAIKDGKIVAVADERLLPPAKETIDARGRFVMPGVVDPEAHPGHSAPWEDDARTETRAAAAGGVTTWCIHDPSPRFGQVPYKDVCTEEDLVSFTKVFHNGRDVFARNSMIDFLFVFQLESDEQAAEIPVYAREFGVTDFKFYCHVRRTELDSFWISAKAGLVKGFDDGTFFLACQKAAEVGAPAKVMFHPENWEISRILEKQLLADGRTDMGAWDDRSPWYTESHHVRSFGYLGKITGATMYVQHTTNPLTIEEIVKARAEGTKMYAQTGAVWLYLTRDDWRINVPLRNREAIEATWAALRDGIIDCVGSDHVVARGKRVEMTAEGVWSRKKSGFPSRVEMHLPIMLHEGVNKGRISFERMVEVLCEAPARIFGIYPKKGAIQPGADADLVFVDLNKEVTVQDEMVHTRPGWTLLHGHKMKGWPVLTMVRGKVVAQWQENAQRTEIVGSPAGQYVPRFPGKTLWPIDEQAGAGK